MKIKKDHIILILIVLLGIVIRIILFRNETFIGIDGSTLARLGKNLIENGRYVFGENYNWGLFFPPGYPALVGTLNLLTNDLFIAGKLVSLFSSLSTIFLFYLLGKELNNEESGLFAAFVFAIYPTIVRTSVWVATESLFICMIFFSIYLLMVSIRKNNPVIYVLMGISIAMSYLIRPEGIILLLLPFLSADRFNLFKDKRRLLNIGCTLLVFILVASPYLLFIKNSTDKFSLSGKSSYLAVILKGGVKSEAVEYDKTAYVLDEGRTRLKAFDPVKHSSILGVIIQSPVTFIKGYLENSRKAVKIIFKLLIPVILPLIFFFFSKDLFRQKRKWIFLLLAVLFFAMYPSFLILDRHMYPVVLFIVLLSSIGFVHSPSAVSTLLNYYEIRENKITSFLAGGIKYIIIIVCILFFLADFMHFEKKVIHAEHMKAGNFLKNNISSEYEKLNVMHRVPFVSFFSNSRFTMMPYAPVADMISFAKLYKVDYIAVDEWSSIHEWEFHDELINMEKYSDEVELVYQDNSTKLIKLFRVKY